jgi:hypothetical protein
VSAMPQHPRCKAPSRDAERGTMTSRLFMVFQGPFCGTWLFLSTTQVPHKYHRPFRRDHPLAVCGTCCGTCGTCVFASTTRRSRLAKARGTCGTCGSLFQSYPSDLFFRPASQPEDLFCRPASQNTLPQRKSHFLVPQVPQVPPAHF